MCQICEVLASDTVLRPKDDSFQFFWLNRESEESLQIRKVLASDVVLRAQERIGTNCANAVATNLSEGLLQISRLSVLKAAEPSRKPSAGAENDDGDGTETGTLKSEAAS